ncbi:hypothetical protein Zm00014a_024420 [Zea mays]|uniref:Uncharacterized protein n=1 Tax=Zea mays TaxID=4577 RepID=A0A3L6E634_MAIZE|nr:hypothetical protein Zm00014a_024420 [Zea mays]
MLELSRGTDSLQMRTTGTIMNLHRDMYGREQMRTTIQNQEQVFRQQVHELHRLYHVQKQLMQVQQAHAPAPATPAPAVLNDAKPRRPQLDIWCSETARNDQQQFISFKNTATAPAPAAPAEDCNLELTLATGPSSSGSCDAGRWQGKRLKASSNSGSAATAVSSTSTDSELARFGDIDVVATPVARFHGEVTRRMDEVAQGPWMYRCLSLKTA